MHVFRATDYVIPPVAGLGVSRDDPSTVAAQRKKTKYLDT